MPKLSSHDKLARLKRFQMTKAGHQQMLEKLENLKSSRPAAVKELARAREMGDLSENGLYTAAKARLNGIDSQIFRLEMTLKLADVKDTDNSGFAQIGSKVTIQDGKNEVMYEIVGDLEANPKERRISPNSPIGKTLLGKKPNDTAEIITPSGVKKVKILKIH